MIEDALTTFHVCSGLGGGAIGFQRAGFEHGGAVDIDDDANADFHTLTGDRATYGDIARMEPEDFRQICPDTPDVAFMSTPCKGYSGCLPEYKAQTQHYQDLNNLATRSVFLTVEAWRRPPPLLLFEMVPRIRTRGPEHLAQIKGLLHRKGYAVEETVHDLGVLGGLAQHRLRFLLVARHMEQVPVYLRVPVSRRVLGIGEVLAKLPCPVPGVKPIGRMHELPMLSPLNWLRLALILAGKDWRSLPELVRLVERGGRPNGPYGVQAWVEPSRAVLGHSNVSETWAAVADVRVQTVRREGGHMVKGWEQPSSPVIGHPKIHNFPAAVADIRLGCEPRNDAYGVAHWAMPSHTVLAHHRYDNAMGAVGDPRVPEVEGPPIDLDPKAKGCHMVIRAADGTWHRPITTAEFGMLQGLPLLCEDGTMLQLAGRSHARWRERIGNCVPPPAAESIARECRLTLEYARRGQWALGGGDIWVRNRREELRHGIQ